MLSAPEMAPKVSQGVTTVIAGNCGISLAPAPNGMRSPVTPPLDTTPPSSIDVLVGAGFWRRVAAYLVDGLILGVASVAGETADQTTNGVHTAALVQIPPPRTASVTVRTDCL